MAQLSSAEQAAMDTTSEKKALLKKANNPPFFYWWTKDKYLKTYTPNGYPDGKGLKTKDGQTTLRLPRWKLGIHKARWYMPLLMLLFAAVILILLFYSHCKAYSLQFAEAIKEIYKKLDGWNGPLAIISTIAFFESLWFAFYYGFMFIFYFRYKSKEMKKKSVIELQTMNVAKVRRQYGTLSYAELVPQLGPKKTFCVSVLDDPTTLHDNMGWIVKTGITNDPIEISLARKGLLSKRMWEERPDDVINKYIANWGKNGKQPDKNYIYYVVTNTIDKLHCFSEGDTGSGKTEAYASPESIFTLRHVSRPSVLFTCKGGDEKATVDQARCLDIKIQHITLNNPGTSDAFNPLYLPFLYHKLKRQLKYSIKAVPMNITPWDWENLYDIEIRQKDNKSIKLLEDISTKEELLAKLSAETNDKNIDSLAPNWKDPNTTLQDLVNIYKSWENKKHIVVDIKKHFLMTDRLAYWTVQKKKSTSKWYRCGNWLFETAEEYKLNKEKLLSMMEAEFQSSIESVITNVMNEEKNKSADAFWNNQVRLFLKMFTGVFFDLVEMGDFSNNKITMSDAYFNLPTLCAWLNHYCESAQKMKELAEGYANIIPTIEKSKSNMIFPDQTFQSITGSVNAITQYYSQTSELLPIITRNDFNPLDFGLNQMLLTITTNNNEDAKANVLLKDIVGQVTNACNFICNNNVQDGKNTMPRPIRIIADEAGSGAPIPWASINAIATKGRSQKILEGLYYQTTKQIQTQYPNVGGAEEIIFGNMALKRCIKASAEDSLKKWESILGKGFATTKTDVDKKQELAGAGQENPYFPAEYIRNKPMWNSLIKIGEMKTIDVSSVPLFPTYFKQQIAIEAKKHEPKAYKKRTINSTSFRDNCYLNLEDTLKYLTSTVGENYNFNIMFRELEMEVVDGEDGPEENQLPFYMRFSPEKQTQNYASNLENWSEWEKKNNEAAAKKSADDAAEQAGINSEDLNSGDEFN